MALGAERGAIVRLVMRDTALLVAGGAVLGLVLASALTRFIASLLFDLAPNDVRRSRARSG